MKPRILPVFIVLYLLCVPSARALELIVTIPDCDVSPHTWLSKGRVVGPLPDTLRELGRRAGITITPKPRPFLRGLFELENGVNLGHIGALTPQRREFANHLSSPLLFSSGWLFTHRRSFDTPIKDFSDLEGRTLINVRGFSIGRPIRQRVKKGLIKLLTVESYEAALQLLADNKGFGLIGMKDPITFHIRNAELVDDVLMRALPITNLRPIYLLVSPNYPDLSPALQRSLERHLHDMINEGWSRAAYARYGVNFHRLDGRAPKVFTPSNLRSVSPLSAIEPQS